MKTNGKELFEIVRQIVRDEMNKVLPEMIRSHLTEQYIRRMVTESSSPVRSRSSLSDVLDDGHGDNNIPHPLNNSTDGVYEKDRLTSRYEQNEGVSKLKKDLGPLSFVFDDAKVPEEQVDSGFKVEGFNDEFKRMNELVDLSMKKSASAKEAPQTPEQKMREIEMRRKLLEVKVR